MERLNEQIQCSCLLLGGTAKVHASSYSDSQKEVSIQWDKQVEWAARHKTRAAAGESFATGELVEAQTILMLHEKLFSTLELLKPDFIKRGLPLPVNPLKAPPVGN